MSLLGGSQQLTRHERVDSATVNQDFTQAIQKAGGSSKAYPKAVRAETKKLFDCGVDELYEGTGGRKGDRSSLPKEVQKAYMVAETLSSHRLNASEPKGSQYQQDAEIVSVVEDTAKTVRSWLPW